MSADPRPGVLPGLLDVLGVLDTELTGSLDSTLLTLGFRELAAA